MKKLTILVINFYQDFISIALKNILGVSAFCRFEVTCSEYSKKSIQEYGVARGLNLSIRRIITCQPFYKAPFSKNNQQEPVLRGKKVLDL